jgi:hemolysin III
MKSAARFQSPKEEIANSITAGIGLIAAVATVPLLIVTAPLRHSIWAVTGTFVFAVTMILGYLTSTIYHALPRNRLKQLFRVFDHAGIFLLIAGSYTPFTLGPLRGPCGWTLFSIVWVFALSGILLKIFGGPRYHRYSTYLYIGLGWIGVFAAPPALRLIPSSGLAWIVAGGLAYTVGAAFYSLKKMPFHHVVWHLFVLTGTTCHFCAVFWYVRT